MSLLDLMTELARDVQPILRRILLEAAVKRTLVYTNDYVRQVGKTTSLVNFAREFDFSVLVNHRATAQRLREETGYAFIYSADDPCLPSGRYVVDETVKKIPDNKGLEIITGCRNCSL